MSEVPLHQGNMDRWGLCVEQCRGRLFFRESIFIEHMTSDRELKASREGLKSSNYGSLLFGCHNFLFGGGRLNPEPCTATPNSIP